ncbi:MAG: hypothetical protein HQL65_19285, partial [Magnetococcales bacterium]|nr:hypothetical protein [Magnetococcales bacterium]
MNEYQGLDHRFDHGQGLEPFPNGRNDDHGQYQRLSNNLLISKKTNEKLG